MEPQHQDTVEPLFPSFLFRRQFTGVSELNTSLASRLAEICVEPAGASSAGRGALRTRDNIFHPSAAPEILALRDLIAGAFDACARVMLPQDPRVPQAARGFDLLGWAYILGEGDFLAPHLHPQATIVGTYYVRCPPGVGQDKTAGDLVLLDPSPASTMRSHTGLPFPNSQAITPREGLLVLFPSHIVHFVPPFTGQGDRIAVSFDFVHQPWSARSDPFPRGAA